MSQRIVIIQKGFHYSGATTQRMLGYANAFVKFGYDVSMIVSLHCVIPEYLKQKIHFVVVQESNRRFDFSTNKNFLRAIKDNCNSDDIIFFEGLPLYLPLLNLKHYNAFAQITEIPFFGRKPTFLQKIGNAVRLLGARKLKGMVVISQGLKDYYISEGVKQVEVINMFVDASRFEHLQKHSTEKYIAYCGTISLIKDGVDILIKSFSIFHKSHSDYKLYLIGLFESKYHEEAVRSLIKELQLENSAICTGSMLPEELANCLTNASILALARPNNDQAKYGFPTKLGEYLCTGNPVVVTKVGEIPNFLHDGQNAVMAEPDSVEDFAEKLDWTASHYEEAKQIAHEGMKLVHKEFSSEYQSKLAADFFISLKNESI